LAKSFEEVELNYNFAGEIRARKLAEKQKSMQEFEERIKKMKERQAEFLQKN